MITQEVQPREITPIVQRKLHQAVETSQPTQQTVAAQTRTEETTPVREQEPAETQQTTQSDVESIAPVAQHEAVPADPAITAATAMAAANDAKPAESVTQEPAPQMAMATRPTSSVKVDHG